MDSVSEGVWSHRDHDPAQEADALEPKGHRIGRRQPNPPTGMHCHRNPVESTVLRMRTMGPGNGVTRYVLSRLNGSRCQPYGVSGGIPQEAKAESKYHSINYCRILSCFLLERCRVNLLEEGDFSGGPRWHLSLQRHGMRRSQSTCEIFMTPCPKKHRGALRPCRHGSWGIAA